MKLAKRSVLLTAFMLYYVMNIHGQGSFISVISEYHPAPGQHINDPLTGTPEAARKLKGEITTPVSLGAFGGYIILGFGSQN